MTVDTYPGRPQYTISGTGPYAVNHEYTAGAIRPFVMVAGVQKYLDAADFTITPAAGPIGNVMLTPAAAVTHAGAQLLLERATPTEQGWEGVQARERGLEVQMDRLTQAVQDVKDGQGRSLQVLHGSVSPITLEANRTLTVNPTGDGLIMGPNADEIGSAQGYAAAAKTARDKSRDWAESQTPPDGPGTKSAKTWAGEAADSAELADSEGNAAIAIQARDKAQEWAENPEDAPVETDKYSALHHAAKAADEHQGAVVAKGAAELAEAGAQTAQGLAEAARDAATVNAEVYSDTAAGLAATVEGEQFQVVSGDEIIRYRHDAGGVASEVARYPTSEGLVGLRDIARDSINLFDYNDANYLDGYRNNPTTGIPLLDSAYSTTGFIPVRNGGIYHTNIDRHGVFYDTSKAYVKAVDRPPDFEDGILISPGDGFVRFSSFFPTSSNNSKEKLYFVESASAPETFEPFGKLVLDDRILDIPGDKIKNHSLTPMSMAYWEKGKNLANPNGRVDGYYMSIRGIPTVNGHYCYWPMIDVKPGESYIGNGALRFVTCFDVGGRAIDPESFDNVPAGNYFTIPAGIYGIVVTSNGASADTFQLEKGTVSTSFEPFQWRGLEDINGERLAWGSPSGAALVSSIDAEIGPEWRDGSNVPTSYGLARLRETRQRLRSIRGGKAGVEARLTVSLIGDSWTHDIGRYSRNLARALWRKYNADAPSVEYGPIGLGWVSLKSNNGANYWNGYIVDGGGWVEENATAYSPDTGSATSSTPGSYKETAALVIYDKGCRYRLFAEGGSGVIRYRWSEEGGWESLDLSALPFGLQIIPMTGQPLSGSGKLRFEVVSGSCKIYGYDEVHLSDVGVVVNKLGASGTRLSHWVELDQTEWGKGFSALNSNLVTILHGTNDQVSRTKAQFKADLLTLVDRVRAASPTCDVLLIAPCENMRTGLIPMSEFAAAMYEVARHDRDVAYIDLQQAFGAAPADYAFGSDRPWFAADGIHPDPNSGGWAMTDAILGALGERSA